MNLIKRGIIAISILFITVEFSLGISAEEKDKQIEDAMNKTLSELKGRDILDEYLAYSKKISFDIKGMDVVDVIKMIATEGNLNVVIGRNVTGRVTMFLKDVDLWDALEIILAANNLAYEQKGSVINIMTERDYEAKYGNKYKDERQLMMIKLKYLKATNLSQTLSQIKSNVGKIVVNDPANTIIILDNPSNLKEMQVLIKQMDRPVVTKILELNYAKAEEIKSVIQELLTKDIGSFRIDARTNKIVVTDYPEKVLEIENIVLAFDEKTPQVLIDAQIIEIKPEDKFQMGVDWDYWINKNLRLASSLPLGTTNKLSIGEAAAGLVLGEAGDYKAILDLLRTIGETKILSSPRIVVTNNQEAKILVGTKEAYATQTTVTGEGGTVTTSESVTFVDVGIKLYVTPTINRDGFVSMKIKPEVSSVGSIHTTAAGEEIPEVSTSEAETEVLLKDGVTIIIAGLKKDEKHKTVKKLPLLGDIPLLGFLFRSTSNELKKTELVIFLTPHIISGASPVEYTSITEDKLILDSQKQAEKGPKDIERIKE